MTEQPVTLRNVTCGESHFGHGGPSLAQPPHFESSEFWESLVLTHYDKSVLDWDGMTSACDTKIGEIKTMACL